MTTDACGRFCVYVPRWDIDRILRFRLARICWPEFVKPDIRDIWEWIKPLPEPPRIRKPPRPEPDPAPDWLVNPGALQRVGELLGPEAAERLQGIRSSRIRRVDQAAREAACNPSPGSTDGSTSPTQNG